MKLWYQKRNETSKWILATLAKFVEVAEIEILLTG